MVMHPLCLPHHDHHPGDPPQPGGGENISQISETVLGDVKDACHA